LGSASLFVLGLWALATFASPTVIIRKMQILFMKASGDFSVRIADLPEAEIGPARCAAPVPGKN
jgi:hypothetical protein